MRRIKSAPANLAAMCNRKISKETKKDVPIVMTTTAKIDNEVGIKLTDIKNRKKSINTFNNVISDLIFDTSGLQYEENFILAFIITYFTENFMKRDKIKDLQEILVQTVIRFAIGYLIHHQNVISEVSKILHLY